MLCLVADESKAWQAHLPKAIGIIIIMLKKETIHLAPNDETLLLRRGFRLGEPLNTGSFACVCKGTYHDTPVAVKVIDLEKTTDDYRLKFLPRELYTMKKLKHKHLVEVIEIFVAGNRVLVFMELANGGDFIDLMRVNRALNECKARYYYAQFGDALRYMHSKGFAHRDIKCENILLNQDRTMSKMTDFGFTRSCFERNSGNRMLSDTFCGSTSYLAPEVLQGIPYDPLVSDVWSIGVVLFVLVQNRLPFDTRDAKRMLHCQLSGEFKYVKNITDELKSLIVEHFNPKAELRITMENVLAHPWFSLDKIGDTSDCQLETIYNT